VRKRKAWDKESMVRAVKAVRDKEMGLLKASKMFNVPRETLKDYVKSRGKEVEHLVTMRMGRKPVLPAQIENKLVNYCLLMEMNFFGLTTNDIKRMAFQTAITNSLPQPFSTEKAKAGNKWLQTFLRRHPTLSLRKPQPISAARINGFTPENVAAFFDIFEKEMGKIKFSPYRLFNIDETGITVNFIQNFI
jgi:hypothetical protein